MEVKMSYNSETGSYNGNKTISLNNDDKRVISFGYKKAKAIVELYEDIKAFVEDCEANGTKGANTTVTIDTSKLTDNQKANLTQFIRK
jgi:hypothetical protein